MDTAGAPSAISMGVSPVAVTHAWHTLQGFANGTEAFDTVSLEHDVGSFDKGRGRTTSTVDMPEDVGRFHRQSIKTTRTAIDTEQVVCGMKYVCWRRSRRLAAPRESCWSLAFAPTECLVHAAESVELFET